LFDSVPAAVNPFSNWLAALLVCQPCSSRRIMLGSSINKAEVLFSLLFGWLCLSVPVSPFCSVDLILISAAAAAASSVTLFLNNLDALSQSAVLSFLFLRNRFDLDLESVLLLVSHICLLIAGFQQHDCVICLLRTASIVSCRSFTSPWFLGFF
jgi:hypothetical protein